MNELVKAAAILAAAFVAVMALYLYFSPYHSCVRALTAAEYEPAEAALACLHGAETDPGVQAIRQRLVLHGSGR